MRSSRKWRRRTAGQWRELLERQAVSGQSVEAFCRAQSVTTASFYRWRRQLSETAGDGEAKTKASSPAPTFLDLGAVGGGGGWELELALGEGVVLRVRGG